MSRWLLFAGILMPAVLMRLLLALFVPPGNAPDERGHYNYVRALAETGCVPRQQVPTPTVSDHNEYYQPPVYYLAAAPIYRLFRTEPERVQFPALRFFNVALSMIAIALCHGIARLAIPHQSDTAYSAMALAASLPAFAGTSSSINNDVLLCVCVEAGTWMVLRAVRRGHYGSAEMWGVALMLGIGFWIKFSAVCLIPVLLIAAWWLRSPMDPVSPESPASAFALLFGRVSAACPLALGLAAALPWLFRQWLVYGDPSGTSVFEPIAAPLAEKVPYALFCLSYTFWVAFGRANEIGWPAYPVVWFVWNATCVLGFVIMLLRSWRTWDVQTRRCMSLLVVGGLVQFALLIVFGVKHLQCQGRYLFPMLPAFALAIAAGIREWLPALLRPAAPLLWCVGLHAVGAIYATQAVT